MNMQLLDTDTGGSRLLAANAINDTRNTSYSAFGLSHADTECTDMAAYNGARIDPISNTYHLGNGYRAYSPLLMRFNCPDSFSPFGAGGVNAYAYCGGDPINNADPGGHMFGAKIALAIISAEDAVEAATIAEEAVEGAEAAANALNKLMDMSSPVVGDRVSYARGAPLRMEGQMSQADIDASGQLVQISNKRPNLRQIPAREDEVSRIWRGADGMVMEENLLSGHTQIAHGSRLYVHRSDEFLAIRTALPRGDENGFFGHTSMTQLPELYQNGKYQPVNVFSAGEIYFDQGKITRRNNSSGHYLPDVDIYAKNCPPTVLQMLNEGNLQSGFSGYVMGRVFI